MISIFGKNGYDFAQRLHTFFSVFASHIGHIARYAPFSRNDLSYSTSSPLSSVQSPINTMRSIILAINVVNVKAPITRLTRLPLAPDKKSTIQSVFL